jgi:predicted dithiol-disulfide oxidoreductase (DUF899 family)
MSLPEIVTREQWLAARTEFLAREKAFTRARDALNAERRRLPMVRVDKEYTFESTHGRSGLAELFAGRRQLIVQHVMFDPAWEDACPGCTAGVDETPDALLDHLRIRDTEFVLVSRTPLEKIEKYRRQRGWSLPWYSSFDSDFNYDFHVSLDAAKAPVVFNYRDEAALRQAGMEWILEGPSEQPGLSCFLREGGEVFHTYSTFARGTDHLGGSYALLDLTALGRQEAWEEPKGRSDNPRGADPTFSS